MIIGKNNKGSVEIAESIIKNLDQVALKLLFSHFYPIHVERVPFTGNYLYFGYSEYFKEVAEGQPVPKYTPVITWEHGDEPRIRFDINV